MKEFYNTERSRMLEKRNVNDLSIFLEKWSKIGIISESVFNNFNNLPLMEKETILYQMIYYSKTVSLKTKIHAICWLINHGFINL